MLLKSRRAIEKKKKTQRFLRQNVQSWEENRTDYSIENSI